MTRTEIIDAVELRLERVRSKYGHAPFLTLEEMWLEALLADLRAPDEEEVLAEAWAIRLPPDGMWLISNEPWPDEAGVRVKVVRAE